MSTRREAIHSFLLLRRELGLELIRVEHWLHDFAAFMVEQQATCITAAFALPWALLPRQTAKAISVNKQTAWLVFSPAFCVAAAGTERDYAPAAAP